MPPPFSSMKWFPVFGSWRMRSACRGLYPTIFFPTTKDSDEEVIAKAACSGCPVIDECLRHALDNGIDDGIWGGLNEEERRRVKRKGRKV